HGRVHARLDEGIEEGQGVLADLDRAGVSLDEITGELVTDGVRLFSDAFDQLLGALASKRRRNLGPNLNEQTITLGNGLDGELRKAEETWRAEGNVRRLWQNDSKRGTGQDESKWLH